MAELSAKYVTQKRPQKIVHGRKKLEAVTWQNLAKSGRKDFLDTKPYNYF
jgi:hypothetical protein